MFKQKDPPLITVSMSYYRKEDYVRSAVRSILAQTETRWRLVILNDGGDPQKVWKPLEDIRDERIIRFDLPVNRGTFFAHSVSLEACDTPFFTPHGADDESDPRRLQDLLENSAGVDLVAAPFMDYRADGTRHVSLPVPPTFSADKCPWVTTWCNLWRTDFLRHIGGLDAGVRNAFDGILAGLAAWAGKVKYLPNGALYHYFWRKGALGTQLADPINSVPVIMDNERKWRRIFETGTRDVDAVRDIMCAGRRIDVISEVSHEAQKLRRKMNPRGQASVFSLFRARA